MDTIFNESNFINEIIWKRNSERKMLTTQFSHLHDLILFYIKDKKNVFNKKEHQIYKKVNSYSDNRGSYDTNTLLSVVDNKMRKGQEKQSWNGIDVAKDGRYWTVLRTGPYAEYIEKHFISGYTQITSIHDRLDALDKANLIYYPPNGKVLRLKRYISYDEKILQQNIITDIELPNLPIEQTNYPTQKPLALLKLLINANCVKDNIVLDPFCGTGTTCIAAEKLGCNWIGIDISEDSEIITKLRFENEIDKNIDITVSKNLQ